MPGGTFQNYTATSNSFTIPQLNVPAGSSVLIVVNDASGRTGGDSDITDVSQTGDSSCLTGAFPSSTVQSVSASATSSKHKPTSSTSSTPTPDSSATHLSGGTIGALVAGAIVLVGALIAIGVFLRKRRKDGAGFSRGGRPHLDMGGESLSNVRQIAILIVPRAFS